jgi:hypothetical protein
MAEVYRGTQRGAEGFSKTVAVKRVLPGYSNDPQFAEMFVSEATIASRLMHPNVVAVTDFDRDTAGRLFLVMELVEGRDLRALMTTGRLPPTIVVYIVSELLRALGYAHALHHDGRPMQIVHRDVSPHNVLVSWDGAVKLSDFGIAKAAEASPATRTGVVKGKAAYLSPEQARAESLDHRSDLFAAGVVLYELLTDKRLFAVSGGAREAVIIHRVLNLQYPSPGEIHEDISEALDGVCRWLLARDRDQRPADAFEALDALLACPEASARGARGLAEVMRERFPREAPSLTTPAHSGPVYETPSKPPVGDFTDSEIDAREAAYNLRSIAVDPVARVPTKTEPTPGAPARDAAAGSWAPSPDAGGADSGSAGDRGGDAVEAGRRGPASGWAADRGGDSVQAGRRGPASGWAADHGGDPVQAGRRGPASASAADRGGDPVEAGRRGPALGHAPGAPIAADHAGAAPADGRAAPRPGRRGPAGSAPDGAQRAFGDARGAVAEGQAAPNSGRRAPAPGSAPAPGDTHGAPVLGSSAGASGAPGYGVIESASDPGRRSPGSGAAAPGSGHAHGAMGRGPAAPSPGLRGPSSPADHHGAPPASGDAHGSPSDPPGARALGPSDYVAGVPGQRAQAPGSAAGPNTPSSGDAREARTPSSPADHDGASPLGHGGGSPHDQAAWPDPGAAAQKDRHAIANLAPPAGERGDSTTTPVPGASAAPESTAGGRRSDRISGPTVVRDASPASRWPDSATRPTAPGSLVPGTLVDSAPTRHTPAPISSPPRRAWWAAFVLLATAAVGLGYLNWRTNADERTAPQADEAALEREAPSLGAAPGRRDTSEAPSGRDEASPRPAAIEEAARDADRDVSDGASRQRGTASGGRDQDRSAKAADAAQDSDATKRPSSVTTTKKRPHDAASSTRTTRRRRRTEPPPPPPPEPAPPTKPKKVGDDLLSPDL